MGIGDSIMNIKKRHISTNNLSAFLDISIKTNSTFATPERNNIKGIIDSYSLSKKKLNYPAIITDSNNLKIYNERNNKFINYLHTQGEINRKSNELIDNADQILKERKNNHLILNKLVKSTFMKKVDEMRLDNYKVKMLKNKRNEINNKILNIQKAINTTEKIFEKDYNNFYQFMEKNDKSIKNQEYLLNKYKKLLAQKEVEYNQLTIQNKKLKRDIELLVKKIMILKNYGSFIHKVFKTEFKYENVKKSEDKNYLNTAEQLVKIYDKNDDKNIDNNLPD